MMWAVLVTGGSSLLTLIIQAQQFIRSSNGKATERQVEPTAISDLREKIDTMNSTVASMNREMGATSEAVANIEQILGEHRQAQRDDINGAHRRIDELSKEVSRHSAQIEGIQRHLPKSR